MTLPSLITNIKNKGYVEKFNKAYSAIQQATLMIEQETGVKPAGFNAYQTENGNDVNIETFKLYGKYLKLVKNITPEDYHKGNSYALKTKYKFLNGEQAKYDVDIYYCGYIFPALTDGTVIGFTPIAMNNCYSWDIYNAKASAKFIIDVNGQQKPNQVGRDIFIVYLGNDGKFFAPETYKDASADRRSDCNPQTSGKNGYGYTCSHKIITEGKMNY